MGRVRGKAVGSAAKDAADLAASSRPLSRDLTGLVIGEGVVFLVLEEWRRAVARAAAIHAKLCGYDIGGIVVHSGLTVTKEGLSLSLLAIKGRLSSSFGEGQEAGRISVRYRASPLPDNAAATKRAWTLATPSVQAICVASIHNVSDDVV